MKMGDCVGFGDVLLIGIRGRTVAHLASSSGQIPCLLPSQWFRPAFDSTVKHAERSVWFNWRRIGSDAR